MLRRPGPTSPVALLCGGLKLARGDELLCQRSRQAGLGCSIADAGEGLKLADNVGTRSRQENRRFTNAHDFA